MHLSNIKIKNYKSIKNITIPVKKYGDSYTTIFVGINEAGKSNILDAISLLSELQQKKTYNYQDIACRSVNDSEYVDVYYSYLFENEIEWKKELRKKVDFSAKFETMFILKEYTKNVYLTKGENSLKILKSFVWEKFNIEEFSYALVSQTPTANEKIYLIRKNDEIAESDIASYKKLDKDSFNEILAKTIQPIFDSHIQDVSVWKANEEYLITKEINLSLFAEDTSISVPLMNLFTLCEIDTKEKIKNTIIGLTANTTKTLSTKLGREATKYINDVWKEHNIRIEVDIEFSTKLLRVFIYDKDNEDICHNMSDRSQGFKHFISFILHISISNKNKKCKNQIILIDEPENHLHPSGIRYMRDELLKTGQNNYIFVSTHAPFLIDTNNMERHFIVTKKDTETNIQQMEKTEMLADDEVLGQAFGINVMVDLMPKNKILVEGLSDLKILKKALNISNKDLRFGITHGSGSNIIANASLLQLQNIKCFVMVDDDHDGNEYKRKIIAKGSPYSVDSVFTLRDLNGEIVAGGTIEDALDPEFITKQANKVIQTENDKLSFCYEANIPIISQIKAFLHKEGLADGSKEIIDKIKLNISDNFNPNSKSLAEKNSLLDGLVKKLIQKIG